jgi:hypothetical protein
MVVVPLGEPAIGFVVGWSLDVESAALAFSIATSCSLVEFLEPRAVATDSGAIAALTATDVSGS